MDAKNILVNGESLDVILRHYYAIPTLIKHAKLTKNLGGSDALKEWDYRRAETIKNIKIEIE